MICLKCIEKAKWSKGKRMMIVPHCSRCGKYSQSFVDSDKYNMVVCDSSTLKDGCDTF